MPWGAVVATIVPTKSRLRRSLPPCLLHTNSGSVDQSHGPPKANISRNKLESANKQAWLAAITAVHKTWAERKGNPRTADPALMAHVEFLSPARFHEDMDEAWTTFCSS